MSKFILEIILFCNFLTLKKKLYKYSSQCKHSLTLFEIQNTYMIYKCHELILWNKIKFEINSTKILKHVLKQIENN